MAGLADYLDLLEPRTFAPGAASSIYSPTPGARTTGFAPPAAQALDRDAALVASVRRYCSGVGLADCGLAAGYDPGSVSWGAPTATKKGSRTSVMTPQRASAALIVPRQIAPYTDTGAKNRADCATFCANPANAIECVPASRGGTGACSPWVDPPPAAAPTCPDGSYWNGVRCFSVTGTTDPGGGGGGGATDPGPPSCPDGSTWNGVACATNPAEPEKKSALPWLLAAAVAYAAWRKMR
jgi:hypothetical protein